ncbi:MAG: phosphonoacetaldehyde reductase [Selenomonadaceae bacterium]|nr:phosphonoacetaldehyde reductase [Selenomonadaceae bacterium]
MQEFLRNYKELDQFLESVDARKIFIVHGNSARHLKIWKSFVETFQTETPSEHPFLDLESVSFTNFEPNPRIESVNLGVEEYRKKKFDLIVAIGGGSAIDVAKGIKLYAEGHLKYKNPLLAIPTTAGSGSESTRFAVVYKDGVKQSLTDDSILPDAVFLDPTTLESLSDRQRKVSMLDALCHAIESTWSVNSTDESQKYSAESIRTILENYEEYLENRKLDEMLLASNLAGRAINISQTTAGHAMSYKLTSEFGLSHGESVAICDRVLWNFMKDHLKLCIDPRGEKYLEKIFEKLEPTMNQFTKILDEWKIRLTRKLSEDQIEILASSVNPIRIKNHPIRLEHETLKNLYREMSE